ncbi:MAG: phytanoyl-CoA dioxygenase family protein [Pseudomonadaceae bacterium]|nr:phytanoyl-CoA dioxygenase family protein [Pseudomonadaceae bacterium]
MSNDRLIQEIAKAYENSPAVQKLLRSTALLPPELRAMFESLAQLTTVTLQARMKSFDDKLKTAATDLERDGVCVIPAVFDTAEIDAMRGGVFRALLDANPTGKYRNGGKVQYVGKGDNAVPSIMFWPTLISTSLNGIRVDPRMAAIVAKFVGPNARQLNNQVYLRLPSEDDSFNWHQDIMFRQPIEDHPRIEETYLQTIVAIDDVTADNGGIEFIMGSHKFGKLPFKAEQRSHLRSFSDDDLPQELRDLERKVPQLEAGDMMLWGVLTAHASRPNRTTRTRLTYMNGFCAVESAKDWPIYSEDGVVVEHADNAMIPRDY